MTRMLLTLAASAVWLVCFGAAMVTIIPLSAAALFVMFDVRYTMFERLEGLGFIFLGLLVVSVLFVTLTALTRLFTRKPHAAD